MSNERTVTDVKDWGGVAMTTYDDGMTDLEIDEEAFALLDMIARLRGITHEEAFIETMQFVVDNGEMLAEKYGKKAVN